MGAAAGEHGLLWSFFRTLRPLVEELTNPDHHVVLHFMIDGKPVKRKAIYPEYKGNRAKAREATEKSKQAEEEFRRQSPLVKQALLDLIPCHVYESPVLEADDLMFDRAEHLSYDSLAECICEERIHKITVVTADQDLLQLQLAPNVEVYDPRRKRVLEYPAYDVGEYKALAGDKSDNIPAIPGFGPAAAKKLALVSKEDPYGYQQIFEGFDTGQREAYSRNHKLVFLQALNEEERETVKTSSGPEKCEWLKFAKFMNDRNLPSLVNDVSRTMNVYKRCRL